jgi:hypothetical protein
MKDTELHDLLLTDIAIADRAYAMMAAVTSRAQELNEAGLGQAARTVQECLVLSIARLFDPTLRAVSRHLRENARQLPLRSPDVIREAVWCIDPEAELPPESNWADFTRSVAGVLEAALGEEDRLPYARTARFIQAWRDRILARREHDVGEEVSWEQVRELLGYAKIVAELLGRGYLGFDYQFPETGDVVGAMSAFFDAAIRGSQREHA